MGRFMQKTWEVWSVYRKNVVWRAEVKKGLQQFRHEREYNIKIDLQQNVDLQT